MALLTPTELRRTLKISRSTESRFLKHGMPHINSGRLRRYVQDEAIEWFRNYQPKTTSDVLQAGDYVCQKCRFTATLDEATERSKIRTCPQCGAEKVSWLRVS